MRLQGFFFSFCTELENSSEIVASMKMEQINLLAWGDEFGKFTVCTSFYLTENQTCHSPPFRSQ